MSRSVVDRKQWPMCFLDVKQADATGHTHMHTHACIDTHFNTLCSIIVMTSLELYRFQMMNKCFYCVTAWILFQGHAHITWHHMHYCSNTGILHPELLCNLPCGKNLHCDWLMDWFSCYVQWGQAIWQHVSCVLWSLGFWRPVHDNYAHWNCPWLYVPMVHNTQWKRALPSLGRA